MASAKGIDHLPDETLVDIFSHLSFNDLVHSVQYVSSRWREIAHDNHLWRNLVYNPLPDVSDDEIVKTIQQVPKLQTLIIDKQVCFLVVNAIGENCPDLKKLEFKTDDKLNVKSLEKLVQNCQSIEHLTIPANLLYTVEETQLIGQLQSLKTLILSSRGCRNPLLLKVLADGCPALEQIDFKVEMFKNDDLEYFLNKKRHQLVSLAVPWSGEYGKCTLPLLPICKSLTRLTVSYYCAIDINTAFCSLRSMKSVVALKLTFIQDIDIHDMVSLFDKRAMDQLVELKFMCFERYEDILADIIVKNCPLLKVLYFTDCYGMRNSSLEKLHTLEHLEYLSLESCCNIKNNSIESLWKCKHLKYLNLRRCGSLSEEGIKKVIGMSTTLETLKVDEICIEGLPFNLIPTYLPNLSLLSVNYCRGIDYNALNELKTKMPHLTVHEYVLDYSEGDILENVHPRRIL